jgi:hypothetical protein
MPTTGNGPPSLADVNTKARELVEKITAAPAAELHAEPLAAPVAAQLLPDFSRGTVALDEETGQPIAPRQAAELPAGDAGGTTDALAGAKAEIDGTAAPEAAPKDRDPASGRFVSEAAADVADAAIAPAAAAPTGEAAAEGAAAAILERPDPMADYEDVEYEDPDLDKKFTVRVPKDAAAAVRNGYMRRADYSRKTMFLGDLRKTVEPLVGDGRLKAILPLIQRALEDPEYGNFVADAYNRRIAGQSLTPAQAAAAEAGAAVAATAAPAVAPLSEAEDPFLAEALRPYNERLGKVTSLVERMASEEEQRRTQETQARQQYDARVAVGNQGYQMLCQRYGDEFSGNPEKDRNSFMRAVDYGRASGLFDQYGESPSSIVLAYEDLRRERESASASPAVAAVAAATERGVARANAASVSTGTPASPPQRKVVPPPPATRVNGVAADPKEYARQALQRQAAIAGR